MSIVPEKLRAIAFDFGNTLVEFGPRQVERQYAVLANALTRMFGTCDTEHLKTIRDRQIVAPFNNGYRENNLRTVCGELIREIYDLAPSREQVDKL
jgi:FMN phosphatase YigB (HAD superfamily)